MHPTQVGGHIGTIRKQVSVVSLGVQLNFNAKELLYSSILLFSDFRQRQNWTNLIENRQSNGSVLLQYARTHSREWMEIAAQYGNGVTPEHEDLS